MSDLNNVVALITGGGRGNGLSVARAYVKAGANVAITDIHEAALEAAKAELEGLREGARVLTVLADNKDHDAAQQVVDLTVAEFGRIDALVNNAQQFRTSIAVEDTTWDDIMVSYESGVFGTWRFMKAALPHLKKSEGTVINFGSGDGSMPLHFAYGSNKEAIRALTRVAAKEWGRFGITVNVICPYVKSAESEQQERKFPDLIASVRARMPIPRIGDAELHVGSLCVHLTKPEGKFMTGATLDVSGGASIRP